MYMLRLPMMHDEEIARHLAEASVELAVKRILVSPP